MTSVCTAPHRDRLMTRAHERTTGPADVELAVDRLAALMAENDGDRLHALQAIVRAAGRLARVRPQPAPPEEERPMASAGEWSLDNGMLPHIVLGEN